MGFLQGNLHITFFTAFCSLLFLPRQDILLIMLIKFCFEYLQPDYKLMSIYLCISCPKLLYSPYLLSMITLECQSREIQVWLYLREIWKSKPAKHFWVPLSYSYECKQLFLLIWNSVLKNWVVNWTATKTSKKTSIINIDVSSVYLRFIWFI